MARSEAKIKEGAAPFLEQPVGKTVTVTVRGVPFVLQVGAGANANGVAEALERAKAAS